MKAAAPLFMVVTDDTWTTTKLNRNVPTVLKADVDWENRRNANPIFLCRQCQAWRHTSSNCARTLKCSRCAGQHEITQCQSKHPPTCDNYKAFYKEYQTYLEKLRIPATSNAATQVLFSHAQQPPQGAINL